MGVGGTYVTNQGGDHGDDQNDSDPPGNVNLLPAELVKTEVNFLPRKKDIKEQLDTGVEVPGARLDERQIQVVK